MWQRTIESLVLAGLMTAAGCGQGQEKQADVAVPDAPATSPDDSATTPEAQPGGEADAAAPDEASGSETASDAGAQPASDVVKAEPVEEWSDKFRNVFHMDKYYFAGIPSEEGLRQAADRQVSLVISLLPDDQQASGVEFDEPALLEELGVSYAQIPVMPDTFSRADVDRFATLIADQDGGVLVHCASSNRCGGLWAAYLHLHRGMDLEDAIEVGKSAGLNRDSMIEAVRRVTGEQTSEE